MNKIKKIANCFITSLLLCAMISMTVFAAEIPTSVTPDKESQLTIRYVTPEEMSQIIANSEAGVMPYDNVFADNVIFTLSRNSNGSAHAVFYKQGTLFDGCTLSGKISLYTASGLCVANHNVLETGFKSYTSRVRDINPTGGNFAYATYTLTVSDGGQSATASGTKTP